MKRLIQIWGDLEGIASALSTPYPTVASWNIRGIPLRRIKEIVTAAKRDGHTVQPWELHADLAYLKPDDAA